MIHSIYNIHSYSINSNRFNNFLHIICYGEISSCFIVVTGFLISTLSLSFFFCGELKSLVHNPPKDILGLVISTFYEIFFQAAEYNSQNTCFQALVDNSYPILYTIPLHAELTAEDTLISLQSQLTIFLVMDSL
jgi:hypothetical protein